MPAKEFILEDIKRILIDEQIGGEILVKIKNLLTSEDKESVSISNEETNLKGMKDEEIIKWAKENNFDTILTADYDMAKNAIIEKLKVLFLFQEDHRRFILVRIYPIKGWIRKIEEIDY